MLLRPLFFLAGFLRVLADKHGHGHGHGHGDGHGHGHGHDAETTITSDPSVASNQNFDYVRTLGNSMNNACWHINQFWLQIIAGGGLSGLVVGNKLSKKGHTVLVVEYVSFAFVLSPLERTEFEVGLGLMPETRLIS
jgi:hypothetical protein